MTAGTDTTEQVANWQATGVSVSSIERELSELWRPSPDGDSAQGLAMRTSVLNLVVYAEGSAAAERAEETIAQLANSHPSRALIVAAEPGDKTASLDAALSAHCHIAGSGGSKFCCEQVTITARGEAAQHVAGVVAPLLLPDLPTVVWWQGVPRPQEHVFHRMVDGADRLIVDAAAFGRGPSALAQVRDLQQSLGGLPVLADLAWTRLLPWRELLAGLFDDVRRRPFVHGIRSLAITHAAGGETVSGSLRDAPPSCALLVGWIEAATGARPTVAVRSASAEAEGVHPGDLLAIELDATAGQRALHVLLRRAPGDGMVVLQTVQEDGGPAIETRHRLHADDESVLLARELESHSADPLYATALERGAALAASEEAGHGR